jgi:hypothetical protein
MRAFLDEVTEHERRRTIDRLKASSAALTEIVAGGIEHGGNGEQGWTGHDVLAHIAVLSKFYGMLTYQVGTGKVSEVDLLENVRARDVAGEQLSWLTDAELLKVIERDHDRTIGYLEAADATAMHRRATVYDGFSMSALELAMLGLCAHLEIHLEQLKRTKRR